MSVISAFNFLFTADTSEIPDGLKEGDDAAKKLTKSLDESDKAAVELAGSFADLAKGVLAAAAAFFSWGAIKAMAIETAEATNALDAQARALRLDADELATWSGMVERAGGTAEGFQETVRGLLDKGIRDPLDALSRVADRFKGLNDRQADRLGAQLGLDKGTIESMRQGTEGLQKLIDHQRRLGQVTQEQLDVARKFKMAQQDLNTVQDDIRRRLSTLILPILTRWLEMLQELFIWMRDKKEFVISFFGAAATALSVLLLPALVRATLASWAFIAPWAGIAAAITATLAVIALVIDDIHAFRNGADSLIGTIAKNWPIVGVIVNELCDALEILWDLAISVFGFLADGLLRPQQAFENFGKKVDDVMARMAERFPYLHEVFKGIGRAATTAGETISSAFSVMWAIVRPILEAFSAGLRVVGQMASGVVGLFNGAPTPAPKPLPAPGVASSAAPPTPIPVGAPKVAPALSPASVPVPPAPKLQDPATVAPPAPTNSHLLIPTAAPPAPPARGPAAVQQIPTAAPVAPPVPQAAAQQAVQQAKPVIASAAAHPLSAQTSNSITNNSARSKNTNVKIDKIEVNTQATDAQGVSEAIGKGLRDQIQGANDEFDDGVVS